MKRPKIYFMKKLFTLLLAILTIQEGFAQTYNNEWIDFSKTYYKFKVGKAGLCRISQTTLSAIGLAATPAQQFKLYRNGVEVPIYTSAATGILPVGGYLEFWGEGNDGKPDKPLYRDARYQHTEKLSIQSDTSAYFLTVHTGVNKRLNEINNNVAGNVLPLEPFFMYTQGQYFRTKINLGFAAVVGEYVYSSSYDKGEFLSSRDITPSAASVLPDVQSNLFPFAAGPNAQIKFGAVGNALNTRSVKVKINNTQVADTLCDYFNDVIGTASFPVSLITSGSANVEFSNTSSVASDRMVISHYEISYPRQFNLGGSSNFSFQLPARNNGYYLEITNFSNGSVAPVLYDLNLNERYVGDVSSPGKVKFAIIGSASERNMVLVSQEAANYSSIQPGEIQTKAFQDFKNISKQGDYIIISSPLLYNGTNGVNPVIEYKNYRSSATGGGFTTTIVEIDELVDQFAFGISKHPLSIKNFLRFARANFVSTPPKFVLLIGRGMTYREYKPNASNPIADKLNLVPTFGAPASDNMLSSADGANPVPITPIGRIGAISAKEVEDYLEKLKEYEYAQKNNPNTIEGRAWMKNVMQVTGASDTYLGTVLCNYMDTYQQIAIDSLFGGKVYTFCKNTVTPVEQVSNERVTQLFEEGLSLVTYFGHSSSTTLEFNIDNPQSYNNQGKYPVFSVNGCNAGNFFIFDPQRLNSITSISERFTLAKQRGSIAFLASTHFGIVSYLNLYINSFYNKSFNSDYGLTLGSIVKNSASELMQLSNGDFYARLHAEEITLHGDPALKLNLQPKPDYIIEEAQIKISPQFISIAENKFKLSIKFFNIGKVGPDSLNVQIKRQLPDNSVITLVNRKIKPLFFEDSITVQVPIEPNRDKGLNKIIVTLDSANTVAEMSEVNNTAIKEFFIYEDELKPTYPYNYSIAGQQNIKFFASTANPLSTVKQYQFEIDTTALFNSPLKVVKTISSVGGVLEFDPGVNYKDSIVYYWRTAFVPSAGGDYRWAVHSFTFISNSQQGFKQSAYFQHKNSELERIDLDSAGRFWKFGRRTNTLQVKNGVFPTAASQAGHFAVIFNDKSDLIKSVCGISNVIFNVFDSVSFKPWFNNNTGQPGLYGSDAICGPERAYNFQFNILDTASRRRIVQFMDLIPAGSYVVVRNTSGTNAATNTYANDWKGDTSYLGANNSMYHRLLNQGFTAIDQFSQPLSWIFVYKKGGLQSFVPKHKFSDGIFDRIELFTDATTPDTLGYITSPIFGPAKSWKNLHWRGSSLESPTNDNVSLDIIGIDAAENENVLNTLTSNMQDFDISSISAAQYRYLKLRMRNVDSLSLTPYQLRSWTLDYEAAPEGALAPNLFFKTKDTLEIGEKLNFGIAFKNISNVPFDSVKVKCFILNKNNISNPVNLQKRKPLLVADSIKLEFEINTEDYPESNVLFVEFNPNKDQPEQYSFNNFMYRNFYVKPDKKSPLLDVTFDNVHILNRDIVSAEPHIQIKLKDEARFLLLNDTSGLTVQVKYPGSDGQTKTYLFDGDTLRFTPAVNGTENTATIDFFPKFLSQIDPSGDEYELIVKGKDRSNNKAGATEYRISFKIIGKPMISNLLNYPNPFTTSTAFVFTITGNKVPDNMKIQILTVTGKIVREITKAELGNLHIGRNITDFKWDGTDQFGQRLANGVYLYRFITTLDGKKMDKFTQNTGKNGERLTKGENTDRFFNNGYGKMYLMR
jgi:hypothetical protein